jgi:manganese transport protein
VVALASLGALVVLTLNVVLLLDAAGAISL